jgi:peptide chain release factor 2
MIEFDEYKQRAAALAPLIDQIKSAMNLNGVSAELSKLESLSSDQAFWSNMEESGKILKQIKRLKDKLELHAGLVSRLGDLESLISIAIDEGDDSLSGENLSELTSLEKT